MVKAIVSHGEIRPLEPLPPDWREGQPLRVEKADEGDVSAEEIDRDFAVLATLCEASEPADEEQLERALQEARRQAAVYGKTEDRYLDLVRQFPLRPLRTDVDLEAAIAIIDALLDRPALTAP